MSDPGQESITEYWVASGRPPGNKTIHTDRECSHLLRANDIREARSYEIDECDVCGECKGHDRSVPKDRSHIVALREAGK